VPNSTVGAVIEHLGALVLRHDAEGPASERLVAGVAIDDREQGAPLARSTAVLGIGASSDALVADLRARAAAGGAAAVFVKHRPGSGVGSGLGPAQPDQPALVEVAPDLSWEQLHVFLRTALLHVGGGRPGGPQTLFDVANAIAVRVDGAVVIEDEHLRVVAYSSLDHRLDDARRATILGRVIPDSYVAQMREAGITAHLEGSAEPVRFDLESPDFLPRLVIALRSGSRTIGLLWAITDDEREAEARRVLADAAPDVAVELLRHLTADSNRATDRLAAARQLLDGRSVPGVRDLLGADPTGWTVLALRPVPGAPAAADPVARTAQFAAVYLDAYHVPALVAPVSGPQVEMVVGLSGATSSARVRELCEQLCQRTEATFEIALLGAVGSLADDVRGVPASRRDAVAVLDLLGQERSGRALGRVAGYDEVRSEVALQELARHVEEGEHLSRGPVVDLLSSPAKGDRALVETVRVYLDSGGDVTRTAAQLGVHRNTVRYRVDRFATVTGADLSDPAQRLVAQAQLLLSR
jgi:hypothetical protein